MPNAVRVADRGLDRKLLVQQCLLLQRLPLEVQELIADKLIEIHVPVGEDIVRTGEGLIIRRRAQADQITIARREEMGTAKVVAVNSSS